MDRVLGKDTQLGLAGTGTARGGILHGHSPGARRAISSLEGGDEDYGRAVDVLSTLEHACGESLTLWRLGRQWAEGATVIRASPATRCKSDDGAVACGVINGDVKDWRGVQRNVSGLRTQELRAFGRHSARRTAAFMRHAMLPTSLLHTPEIPTEAGQQGSLHGHTMPSWSATGTRDAGLGPRASRWPSWPTRSRPGLLSMASPSNAPGHSMNLCDSSRLREALALEATLKLPHPTWRRDSSFAVASPCLFSRRPVRGNPDALQYDTMLRIVTHMATLTDPLAFRQTVKNPWTLFGLSTAVNRFTRPHTTSPVTGGLWAHPAEVWRRLQAGLIALTSHLAHHRTRQHHDSRQHHAHAHGAP